VLKCSGYVIPESPSIDAVVQITQWQAIMEKKYAEGKNATIKMVDAGSIKKKKRKKVIIEKGERSLIF
jgi:hypothetical protein